MPQNNDSRWNHKWSALALAALLTLFLAFGRYRGNLAAQPPAAAPFKPVAAAAIMRRPVRPKPTLGRATAKLEAPLRGARLREKGEAFGGGREQKEESDAESTGR
jgi:hypothetical protein